jgi:tetratricopeptide (TPR) repeat protein
VYHTCDRETMQVPVIDGAGGSMTVLDIRSIVLSAPRRGSLNPLPPLRLLGELHGDINCAGLDAELTRNIRYGNVGSVLPYLLEDDYSRELLPQETRVATLENDYLLAIVLLDLGGRLWSLRDKVGGRELLYTSDRIQLGNLGLRNAWFPGGVEWNLGTTGHTALTCSPVHAVSLELPDGAPGLRIYEWERMRELVYQVDFRLGPGSRRLVVDVKVTNPNAHAVPVYWWSNVAVASSPGTRVVVPSRSAFEFTYARRLRRVPVPGPGEPDLTYPLAATRTADHFFELDPGRPPWIAAVDAAGVGLLQLSTGRLRGRKLFTWGNGPGGRRWQEFLTGSTQSYFEIQGGLTRTQLEHVPLGPGASWSWTEVYGPVSVPADAVHGDWADAVQCLEPAVAEARAESVLGGGARAGDRQGERVHTGAGWGALESLRREVAREPPSPVIDRLFPRSSLGSDQEDWIALLETGVLPAGAPRSYVVGRSWSGLLEAAADSAATMLHRGVARWSASHRGAAVEAWQAAFALEPDSWLALRNLAAASGLMGAPGRSAEQYLRALDLRPDLPQLRVEAIEALIAAGRLPEAIALAQTAPPSSFGGRFRFLEARAAVLHGDVGRAESILASGLEIADLREGEVSLSDLWLAVHRAPPGAAGARPEVPFVYDFRLDGGAARP